MATYRIHMRCLSAFCLVCFGSPQESLSLLLKCVHNRLCKPDAMYFYYPEKQPFAGILKTPDYPKYSAGDFSKKNYYVLYVVFRQFKKINFNRELSKFHTGRQERTLGDGRTSTTRIQTTQEISFNRELYTLQTRSQERTLGDGRASTTRIQTKVLPVH